MRKGRYNSVSLGCQKCSAQRGKIFLHLVRIFPFTPMVCSSHPLLFPFNRYPLLLLSCSPPLLLRLLFFLPLFSFVLCFLLLRLYSLRPLLSPLPLLLLFFFVLYRLLLLLLIFSFTFALPLLYRPLNYFTCTNSSTYLLCHLC